MILKIAIVQSDIYWEDPDKNLAKYSQLLSAINDIDLIVLPEMFATGFSMNIVKIKQNKHGSIFKWMKNTAITKQTAVLGSMAFEDDNNDVFNRALFFFPDGSVKHYNKRHLFTLANEHLYYSKGTEQQIITYKNWQLGLYICYDLRFPVWSRSNNIDALIYIANWPMKRIFAWNNLLQARAIENMAIAIGVNRVGIDGNNIKYNGSSEIFDPFGKTITKLDIDRETVSIIELDKSIIDKTKARLGFLNDMDEFEIKY